MKRNLKNLSLLLMGALTLISMNSCLNDDNDDDQRITWENTIVNKSLGRFSGTYQYALGKKAGPKVSTYYDFVEKDKSFYISFPSFPDSIFAHAIEVPAVTASATDKNYATQVAVRDSIQALKDALASISNTEVKAVLLTSTSLITEKYIQFYPYAEISFDVTYAGRSGEKPYAHHYRVRQVKTNDTYRGEYPRSILQMNTESSTQVLNVNFLYFSMKEVPTELTSKQVLEFTPIQLYFSGTK